ncbi:MAG TPA: HIT domain-containing protein [Nitrospira sp.]|nr:HIT domain-containing protein [Nitrospira sp.]
MRGPIACAAEDLCDEMTGADGTAFAATYRGDPPRRQIYATEGLRLIVDLSPLLLGHLLLLPEKHFLSFGHLVPELAERTNQIVARILPLYRATFGPPAILEHGSSTKMTSACITHAHWHLLPRDSHDIRRRMREDGLSGRRLRGFEQLSDYAEADCSYYYCSDGESHHAFRADRWVRSQYLRSVVGGLIGIADPLWDWSLVVRKELLRETVARTGDWADRLDQR